MDPAPATPAEENSAFDLIAHGHRDLVQAVSFNAYGDRCATGSVDGRIRVFNRQRDGTWRICDNWAAHTGEILELQWLAPTIYPNLLASLGIEGRFKLWAEDELAAPGRRFSSRNGTGKATFEHRSGRSPFRSFSIRHNDDTRITYFALLAADGMLSVHESEEPETLVDYTRIDEFQALPRPSRGEETCFKVRFDPNPEPCYMALRAGVPADSLSLLVSGLDSVKVYRTRDTVTWSLGRPSETREFYLAAELGGHRGLVRDVAWAPGSFRGYDMMATACQDGLVRVFRIDTPFNKDDGRSWAVADVTGGKDKNGEGKGAGAGGGGHAKGHAHALSGIRAEIDKEDVQRARDYTGQPGQVKHTVAQLSSLDAHRSPVWRVGFDDDGQILGSVGDEGRLMCYRQTPDGSWAKSSELGMMKTRLSGPS